MNIAHIIDLLKIGQLSLDLRAAEHAASIAKSAYWDRIHAYEEEHGYFESKIDRHDSTFAPLFAFTKAEYDAHHAAKRAAYNVKRRWQGACRAACLLTNA